MIITNTRHLISSRIFLLALSFIAISYNSRAGEILQHQSCVFQDSIFIKRTATNKGHNIMLHQDVKRENLYFTSSGKRGLSYQLFLFNMDGKLIRQSNIHEKQSMLLAEMEKGNYLFEVFSNDLRIENGSIVIK